MLVGGSSLAFGVDSTLLEEEFPGYTVVNFGLYAALGTQMMLELSDGQFREGGHRHPLAGAAAADFVLLLQRRGRLAGAGRPFDLLSRLDSSHFGSLLGQFPYFAARKLRYFLQGGKAGAGGGLPPCQL